MMDATSDQFWPAMLFTVLAVIVAAVVLGRNKSPLSSKCTKHCNNETRQQLQSSAKSLKAKDEIRNHV